MTDPTVVTLIDGPIPEGLPDGAWVRLTAELQHLRWHRTSTGRPWLELDLFVGSGVIPAVAFPGAVRSTPPEMWGHGIRARLLARVCRTPEPYLHVRGRDDAPAPAG